VRLCRLCHERPVSVSRIAQQDYRCSRCRNSTPAGRQAKARYNRKPERMAVSRRRGRLRIFVGKTYHSIVRSAEEAERINARIKERLSAFKRLQAGAEVEGVAPDAVCLPATVPAD
jgi:hypothetical protein